jgi:predicted  nucleic acid-binding Zn-ribbon protein
MSNQLKALVALQDLDLMIREAKDPKHATHEEELGFAMSGMDKLERTRERLAKQIDENLLQTYERMSRRFARVVVPVDGRVCMGCFIGLPTASKRNTDSRTVENCENCGRILYRI